MSDPDLAEEALYGAIDNDPSLSRSDIRASKPTPEPAAPVEQPAAVVPDPAPAPVVEPTPEPPAAATPVAAPAPVVEPTPAPATPEPAPSVPAPAPAAAAPAPAPAPVVPAAPAPTPTPDPTAGWSALDKKVFEIKGRNPDMGIEDATAKAKAELGLVEPDPNAPPPEVPKTTAEQLAEVESQLEAAGASEGLLTPEIVNLQKQQARLAGQLAVENARAADADEVRQREVNAERAASRDRLVALCSASGQDAQDRNSPIGQSIAVVLSEMKASDHPDLYEPNAPELIFLKANLRLPPEQRIAMSPAPVAATPAPSVVPPTPPSPAPAPAPTLTPQSVLPVSPSARSAQPAATIDPGQLPRIIQETSADDLDEVLYGKGPGNVMLRL